MHPASAPIMHRCTVPGLARSGAINQPRYHVPSTLLTLPSRPARPPTRPPYYSYAIKKKDELERVAKANR